jgi:hypothetical protein
MPRTLCCLSSLTRDVDLVLEKGGGMYQRDSEPKSCGSLNVVLHPTKGFQKPYHYGESKDKSK